MYSKALLRVFGKPVYVLIALAIGAIVLGTAILFPNFSLIFSVWSQSDISFTNKFNLLVELLGALYTNFTVLSAVYTVGISILFGMNISMLIYFFRRRIVEIKQSDASVGFLGILAGIVGVGCAACGSLIVTSALSLFGTTWLLAYLPLKGEEFGILGIILLLVSLHRISKRIQNPAVCKIM